MALVSQKPERLDLELARGDDLGPVPFNWDIDLTGYTFEAILTHLDGQTTDLTFTWTNQSAGEHNVSLTDTVSAGLPLGKHQWYLRRTDAGLARKYVAGFFEVTDNI